MADQTTTMAIDPSPPIDGVADVNPDAWAPLGRRAWSAVAVVMIALGVATIPRLPPGVCFSDAADLQLASVTLGIMHPPGYAGYTAVGWLLTRIPGVDPAYMVSLVCLLCGLVALAGCMLIQVRLGVSPWIAGAIVMALTAHHRVWTNLVAPEVYAPTLALVVASAYLLAGHVRTGRSSSLWWAAGLYGFAVANRPTVVWTFPFFAAAWWIGSRSRPGFPRSAAGPVAVATFCAICPALFSIGYLWVRDTPETTYNYIEIHNNEVGDLPSVSVDWRAKLERIWYHGTAREFSRYIGNDVRGAWKRLTWLYKEFFLYELTRFAIVLFVLAIGLMVAFSRDAAMAMIVLGLVVGNVVFICTYVIVGMAADLSMLMSAAVILGGVALSPLFPADGRGWPRAVAMTLALGMGAWTIADAPNRNPRSPADALPYLAELDMATMPANAVICSTWQQTPALLFDKHVLSRRSDIEIVNATTKLWARQAAVFSGRPIFAVSMAPERQGMRLTPYRNIFRAEMREPEIPAGSSDVRPRKTPGP